MQVVSVINYKGGVGKTTITANLGVGLAQLGHKVLMLDLDPQTNLTLSFHSILEWEKNLAPDRTIKRWFDAHIGENAVPPSLSDLIEPLPKVAGLLGKDARGRVDLIASHLNLVNTDMHLARELFRDPARARRRRIQLYRILADALEDLTGYDYVLIDCAPDFGLVTQTAVVASDWLLVPSKADQLSSLSISYFAGSVRDLVKDYNSFSNAVQPINPRLLGAVFTMVEIYDHQPTRIQRRIMEGVAADGLIPVFSAYIRMASKEAIQSTQGGIPTIVRTGADKVLVAEFTALRDEFLKKIEEA